MVDRKLYVILLSVTQLISLVSCESCVSAIQKELFLPETYFRDGQIVAIDYSEFSAPQLARTEPAGLEVNVLQYDGNDFLIQNSFDLDHHALTKTVQMVKFWFHIPCQGSRYTASWSLTISNENDEVPRLADGVVSNSFHTDVSELTTPGTIIPFTFSNKIVDNDPGDVITYSMRMYPSSVSGSYPFRMINSLSQGDIQINDTLDYESQQHEYIYQVFADDSVGHRLVVLLIISIKDGNDLPPKFNSSSHRLSLSEDAAVGSRHVTTPAIAAYDQDVGIKEELFFSLYAGHSIRGTAHFDIDPLSGEIIITSPLDREVTPRYLIVLKVKERYAPDKFSTSTLTIDIADTNDTPPRFELEEYWATVEEHSLEGLVVVQVSASDEDLNSILSFSLRDFEDRLRIEETLPGVAEVIISNSDLIDRELSAMFTLSVVVSDGEFEDTALVHVTLTDINDQPPIFSQFIYTFPAVEETASSGHVVGQVDASDADVGENGEVMFRMFQGAEGLFSIDGRNGIVKVIGDLSSDYQPFYELRVEAWDKGTPSLSSVAVVRVTVVDMNTHRPVFDQLHYRLLVREDAVIGSTVLKLHATDADANSEILYAMSATWLFNTPPEGVFIVINTTDGYPFHVTRRGEILLQASLDRETDEMFKFQVTAFDGYFYSLPAATIFINIVDVNDNVPTFDGSYEFSVSEGCGSRRLGQLHATDMDSGVHAQISYFVKGTDYYIHPEQGLLNITRCVDRETEAMLSVMVYASDGDSESPQLTGSVLVYVKVEDINDNKPLFTQAQYVFSYREGFNGTINLPAVTDADLPPNDDFIISMISGDEKYFRLAGNQIVLLKPLSVPAGVLLSEYPIGLKVENKERYVGPSVPDNVATLLLRVTSVNTHDPQFTRSVYHLLVKENTAVGSTLLTLDASDGDGDEIAFTFANQTHTQVLDTFWLDGNIGVISLKTEVDAESSAFSGPYVFQVVARDPYGKFSLATVNVTVVDVNDNAPLIFTDDVEVSVSESRSVGYVLPMMLSVTDRDSGHSGEVTCTIEPALYLSIHQCTTVTLVRRLDYEEIKGILAMISASDAGSPSLTSSLRVTINILPENDNLPIFEFDSYEFNVSENVPGRVAVGTVRATDSDIDILTYSLQPPPIRDLFSISSLGLLYSHQPLDRELAQEYSFNVIASDGQLTTAVRCTVYVVDQNDNPPIFRQEVGLYYITEGSANDHVLQVFASDEEDEGVNAEVKYEILSGNEGDTFNIESMSGIVGVAKPHLIDFEMRREYKLIIKAKDLGHPTQYATIAITIKVRDSNEYAPQFEAPEYRATIAENSPVGTLIAQVTATDDDGSSHVTYHINSTSEFSVSNRGVVMTAQILDGDIEATRNTAILACDDFGLCASSQLHVYLTDINDNIPEFPALPKELNVTEDTPPGTLLLNASAIDLDRDDVLSYWITGAVDLLSIDSSTGVIKVTGSPRAAEISVYHIDIHVSDGPHKIHTSIIINIHEANLYPPVFEKFVYHEIVCETDELNSVVSVLSVNDKDEGLNGLVDVSISAGDWNNTFNIRRVPGLLNTFELTNQRPLVFAQKPYFELELQAIDRARYPKYDYSRATIRLLSGSSSPPLLQSVSTGDITVSHKAQPGDIVYTFVAFVKSNEEKKSLRFAVTPENTSYDVNPETGHLLMSSDKPTPVTQLNVSACSTTSSECVGGLDTKLCSSMPVVLNVKYAPQLPQFYPSSYFEGTVSENVLSAPIVQIFANQSTGAVVNITMVYNELYGELFSLSEDNVIWNAAPLDREYQPAYNLLVIAYGDEGVTTANVHISVLDVNDESPVFVFSEFREETTESQTSAGVVIMVVSVTDDDSDIENIQVTYEIIPSFHSHLFTLNPRGQYCDVVLTGQLDADVDSNETIATVVYSIQMLAYDPTKPSLSTNTTIKVLVRDDNDNIPEFTQQVYEMFTEEQVDPATGLILGTVRATDVDKVDIGKLRYGILEETDFIVVDPVYGQISLNKTIDKEIISHLSFTLQAFDSGGHIGEAALEVNVIDRNDNRPSFVNDTFDFFLFEGSQSFTAVTLIITDADFGPNADLTFTKNGLACGVYGLSSERLDQHTYSLEVKSLVELDRENESVPHLKDGVAVYSCIISAKDNGSVQLSTSKMVTFYIRDLNDSPPKFTRSKYEWAITEVSPVNFTVGYVTATDQDHNSEHRLMHFELLESSSLFSLHQASGEFYLTRQAASRSTDIKLHSLRVAVYDPTSPLTLRDEAMVEIHVLDSNDHAPVFSQLRYIFTISKKSLSDFVGRVSAKDNDTDSWNAEVTHSLRFFNKDLPFSVETETGVIRSSLSDLDTSNSFLFGVVAYDRGIPRQQGSAIVEVKVIAFSTSSYTGTIDEGSTFGQTVKVIPPIYAVDTKVVEAIVYTLQPQDGFGIFAIREDSGIVFVNTEDTSALDYEINPVYHLQVVAGDRFGYGVGANLTIGVTDINDNPPIFSQRSYNFTVSENSHNQVLGRVISSDVDTNSDTIYRLLGDAGPFLVDTDSGVLRVTGGLDVNIQSAYHLHVEARDRHNASLYDTALIVIVVEDINDNSPVFTEDTYSWVVPEDVPINTVVGAVAARDVENDSVSYQLVNGTQDLPFSVDPTTGELLVRKSLDREKQSYYRITIRAKDSTLSNETQVLVIVSDVNDNPPLFGEEGYIGSVTERSQPLTVVMLVFATDSDQADTNNSKISYSLHGLASQFFQINEYGVITVQQEFTSFQLTQLGVMEEGTSTITMSVLATDAGSPTLSSRASLTVTIQQQDEDVPRFDRPIYEVQVDEHKPYGTKVVTVEAKVKDESDEGLVIIYELIGSHSAFTMIDSLSGDIYTQTDTDRERESFFLYTVQAVDNRTPPRTGLVTVAITLLDINDHSPQFDIKRLEFSRTEGFYDYVLLTQVHARDADIGDNSDVSYSIIGGSQDGLFTVNRTTGEIHMVGLFDFEVDQQYHLTVEAIDNGAVRRSDTLDLYVYLTDINDNSPVFHLSQRVFSIKENVHEVTVVSLQATDQDSGYNGEVRYSLIDGDILGDFILAEQNGSAVLSVRQFLNYERVTGYNLTIIAFDLGRPRLTAQITLEVNVEDVSDSKPVFQRPLYEIFIPDNVTVGTRLVELNAGYGVFIYSIAEGNFNEDFSLNSSTGDLVVRKPLQGGSDHQLIIQARDTYTPPTIASTLVKVVVEESDPKPRFAKDTYAGFVEENVPPLVEIIDLTSSDEQRGRAVSYKIIEGNEAGMFTLDEFTGKLFSNIQFDREAQELYSLKIQAFRVEYVAKRDVVSLPRPQYTSSELRAIYDMETLQDILDLPGSPDGSLELKSRFSREVAREMDTTTVKITIRDINDNPPQFETEEHIGIPDSAVEGDVVTYIRATDKDAGDNATIAFGLVKSSTYFRIASDTGAVILLAPNIALSVYDLSVEAVDNNGHSTGRRTTKHFRLIVTRDESRVSYQAPVPYKDLPNPVHLAGNLSRLMGIDVRVESTELVSDVLTNITIFAFVDKNTMMSKSDLLSIINDHQGALNNYFGNLSDIITVTSKPIISSGGGGPTDTAFIILGLVVGVAAIFGILLLTIYWRQIESQRVIAEQKGQQGDLIEDNGDEEADADSGVEELNMADNNEQTANQPYGGMSMPAPMMFPGMMFPQAASMNWINGLAAQQMTQGSTLSQPTNNA